MGGPGKGARKPHGRHSRAEVVVASTKPDQHHRPTRPQLPATGPKLKGSGMPKGGKLKVFQNRIGFHDSFVAASSRADLRAWTPTGISSLRAFPAHLRA